MARGSLRSGVGIGWQPWYRRLAAFAGSCFVGTLATDIAYWRTSDMMWADFSAWLLTAGAIVGYLTIIVALIETFVSRLALRPRPIWLYAIGNVAALILATVNMFVHMRDAWTSVVPLGLILSAVVVLVLIVTAWMTRETYGLAGVEMTA